MPLSTIFSTLFSGFLVTCRLFAMTLALSIPLGFVITFGSMSSFAPLRWFARFRYMRWAEGFYPIRIVTRTFVWIIRGSPLMLQLMIVFFGPGLIWGATVSPNYRQTACIIAFVINYAAYFSEIYRGGIQSVPRGQYEAGMALGMTKTQIFFKITLLQVVKRIVPPMSNEIITLVKDTSIARILSVREIIMEAQAFSSKGYISPLFYSGLFFLAFTGILTILFGRIEKKLSYFR